MNAMSKFFRADRYFSTLPDYDELDFSRFNQQIFHRRRWERLSDSCGVFFRRGVFLTLFSFPISDALYDNLCRCTTKIDSEILTHHFLHFTE